MTRPYLFGILVFLACSFLEVSPRPSNNEAATSDDELTEAPAEKERALAYDETNREIEDISKDILEKIKAINDALKKPSRRNQLKWNAPHQTGGEYVLDKEILEKLQQVIASGKLNQKPNNVQQQESNVIFNDDFDNTRYSRQLASLLAGNQAQAAMIPGPYIMNMPVLVMPPINNMYSNYINPMDYATKIQTRQDGQTSPSPFPSFPSLPSLPPFQWPFASLFPVLIRDPLLSIMNGGGWSNFIEYGQNADVCRKQKSNEPNIEDATTIQDEFEKADNLIVHPIRERKSRQKRAVKKRTVAHGSQLQEIDAEKLNKFFQLKPSSSTAKPVKKEPVKSQDTKTIGADDGDVRFNFLDLFGNKQPNRLPTGPGFFINRLKVRKGGVAIAGPGGVATAGRGGTAIVGPGGLAYTQPGGLAVAGPAARIVALSSDADLTSVAHRLQEQSKKDGSIAQLLQAIPEGKIVATGPIIYYHPNNRYATVQYVPFYGGAKGKYLEVKKDNLGRITEEKIVSEENISTENIMKDDENLLAKVLAKNLQDLKTMSSNVLRLFNRGRRTGSLGDTGKSRFKTQLASLSETSSNFIKLVEEIDDVDKLLKKDTNSARARDEAVEEEYIVEEGVGIESSSDYNDEDNEFFGQGIIAEAKPVGLAIIGDHGIAASRPHATAVAASGVALAAPQATAIAGVDPAALGITLNLNQKKNH